MGPVEWHRRPGDTRLGRAVAVVALAPALGGGLAVVVGALVTLAAAGANPRLLAFIALLALVGGPLSLLYLWPLLTDPDQRAGLGSPGDVSLPRRYYVASALLGVGAHAVAVSLWAYGPVALLLVCSGGGILLLSLLATGGRIDPERRTLEPHPDAADGNRHHVDLDDWIDLDRYRVGDVVFLRPTYAAGRRGPRVLTLPADAYERARPVFEAALDAPADASDRGSNRAVQAVLVAAAALVIGLAAAAIRVDPLPEGFQRYLAVVAGTLALLFLAAAYREA